MHPVHVYQILNYYTPRNELDAGFGVLDNSSNERPDWFEYWPIRNFLLRETLDENAFYGFLSPKFKLKTNLGAAEVVDFIQSADTDFDIALFSPSIHNSAYYLNVFEHGDAEHPGLLRVAERFFARIGRPAALGELICDSRNTVHSNYFIAKPRFWRAWLDLTEQLFAIAELPDDELGRALREPTPYRGVRETPMKIFVLERLASFILATDESFSVRSRDPFAARTRLYKLPVAIICDALKIAYGRERRGQYLDVFMLVRAWRARWNRQIRMRNALGEGAARRCLRVLKSYWAMRV